MLDLYCPQEVYELNSAGVDGLPSALRQAIDMYQNMLAEYPSDTRNAGHVTFQISRLWLMLLSFRLVQC